MAGLPKMLLLISPSEKFLCQKCKNVLREPVQTACGHRYCRRCLEDVLTEGSSNVCIACEKEGVLDSLISFDEMYNDIAIRRELNVQKVRCLNKGCGWTGFFKDYENHIGSCPLEMISCIKSGCNDKFLREHLAEHLEKQCPMRVLACPDCREEITHAEQKSHFSQCPRYPVQCQFCERKIPRQQINPHVDPDKGDCEERLVHCEFREVGCTAMVPKTKMADHRRGSLGNHLLMLMQTIIPFLGMIKTIDSDSKDVRELKSAVERQGNKISEIEDKRKKLEQFVKEVVTLKNDNHNKSVCQEHGSTVEKLEHLLGELKNSFVILGTKVSTSEGVIAVLNNQLEQTSDMVQSLQKKHAKDKEIIESLERKVKAQDRIIAIKDVALAEQDIRIQALEMSSYDGVLLWKISDFTRKRNDAMSGRTTSLYSPCFYTSRHGYKLCARVYLNGDGLGKGNHVSLFFVIMKGPFDALLRWPFRQKVTFMWLDQNNREHFIDALRPDPASSSFQRQNNDMNIASGCPLFMPLSQIDSSRHAYVKDDTAFLKIIVSNHCSDLESDGPDLSQLQRDHFTQLRSSQIRRAPMSL